MLVTAKDAGAPIRAELDGGGGNRTWVQVEILVEDPAGGQTVVHSETVFVGDTPVEYLGPAIEPQWRGRALRLRIKDVVTGDTIADDSVKIRRS